MGSFLNDFKSEEPYQKTTLHGSYSTAGGIITFEWFFGGPIDLSNNESQPMKFNFNHQLKMVYNLATRVLQGFRIKSFVDGTNNGKEMRLELSYLCEIEGFDMPNFNFTTLEFASGFKWFLVLRALNVLSIPFIIRKFRK
ncbi:MAG: hypothetical protein JXA54_11070 [Candidatus Heimdallarchaeota archaeon]|nr:hypothetical protein [Candidatus Heimdallarchaeota archaeon]